MGFIKNLFKYRKVVKLKSGFAVGYHINSDKKDLLYDGEVVEQNINGVSDNILRTSNDKSPLFLVKTEVLDCKVYDRFGNSLYNNLRDAVKNGEVELTEVQGVNQYKLVRGNESALFIPQKGFISDFFKSISEPDERGLRKVTETDLTTRLRGNVASKALSYYINEVGEKVSPEFVEEVNAGEYKIFWAPNNKEIMYDYIYKYDQESG